MCPPLVLKQDPAWPVEPPASMTPAAMVIIKASMPCDRTLRMKFPTEMDRCLNRGHLANDVMSQQAAPRFERSLHILRAFKKKCLQAVSCKLRGSAEPRVGKGAVAPCPPFHSRCQGRVGTSSAPHIHAGSTALPTLPMMDIDLLFKQPKFSNEKAASRGVTLKHQFAPRGAMRPSR